MRGTDHELSPALVRNVGAYPLRACAGFSRCQVQLAFVNAEHQLGEATPSEAQPIAEVQRADEDGHPGQCEQAEEGEDVGIVVAVDRDAREDLTSHAVP